MRRRLAAAATLALALPASFLVGSAPAEAASATTRGDCVVKDSVRTCVTLHRDGAGRYYATAQVLNLDSRRPTSSVAVQARLDSAPCATGRWAERRSPDASSGKSSASSRTGSIAGAGRTLYRARVASLWYHPGDSVLDFHSDSTTTALLGSC